MVTLHHGDCLEFMRTLPAGSVDAVVTDPPYGLRFMGKHWDYDVPSVEIWRECLRVLKPGGHLLSFAGTRTQHRMAVRIEDAGFEIRDMIAWVYGSGFPKSHNLSDEWQGWGTALKPALEPITVARKPLEGTVAQNVTQWGTGAINVDATRIPTNGELISAGTANSIRRGTFDEHEGYKRPWKERDPELYASRLDAAIERANTLGRWPANLIHDGSDEVVGLFPQTQPSKAAMRGNLADIRGNKYNDAQTHITNSNTMRGHDDNGGSAARFFYCAKASKRDRDDGLEGFDKKTPARRDDGQPYGMNTNKIRPDGSERKPIASRANNHPTVKPTELMRYLCRLVTPPAGIVFDPFAGSGSTGRGAVLEGFSFIGCEISQEYFEIAQRRIEAAQMQPALIQEK